MFFFFKWLKILLPNFFKQQSRFDIWQRHRNIPALLSALCMKEVFNQKYINHEKLQYANEIEGLGVSLETITVTPDYVGLKYKFSRIEMG